MFFGGHSGQTFPAVASIAIRPLQRETGDESAGSGRGGGGGRWSAAVVHRISFQPTCAVTCLSNVGSSPSRPVFVKDVELQRVALDLEIVQRRHRVGIVTRPADHATQLVADFADDEVLLRRADTEAKPGADDVFLGQLQFPGTRLNVSRSRRPHALLVDSNSGNGRSLGKSRHDDRQRIRSPRILDQRALEPAPARAAGGAGHDQLAVIEPGNRLVPDAVLPSAFTCVTSNVMPSGPSVPSTNASVVASAQ